MSNNYTQFAQQLAKNLIVNENFDAFPEADTKVQTQRGDHEIVTLDLTPFYCAPQVATAKEFFGGVTSVNQLLLAYEAAKKEHCFESDLTDALKYVSSYAEKFLKSILDRAKSVLTDEKAGMVARWISNLDVYTAVKSVESLLNSRADLALLEIAEQKHWAVHFDHLAIRCGTKKREDAERIAEMLAVHHGYVSTQFKEEAFYQFSDGWNAYPMYKILENGQVLRLFIDQSDADNFTQIIQHWNRVYGYTAHHLAIRATHENEGQREAITLEIVMQALREAGIDILTPTGQYTSGLLLQVFTRPEKNENIPEELVKEITQYSKDLNKMIENGKLLEIVSRKEMPSELAKQYFDLYGLEFDSNNPLHSAPYYQYFLPAQAAHVIKTSVQVG